MLFFIAPLSPSNPSASRRPLDLTLVQLNHFSTYFTPFHFPLRSTVHPIFLVAFCSYPWMLLARPCVSLTSRLFLHASSSPLHRPPALSTMRIAPSCALTARPPNLAPRPAASLLPSPLAPTPLRPRSSTTPVVLRAAASAPPTKGKGKGRKEKEKSVYSDTVYLPDTPFSMRANAKTREPEIQAWWAEQGVYEALRDSNPGETFTLHDGPPFCDASTC